MNFFTLKHLTWMAAIQVSLGGSLASGADLILRERVVPNGSVIRLGDVADISTGSSSNLDELVTTVLLPAPAPGTYQYLRASQIRELLDSRGVDTKSLRFRGAKVVKIGKINQPSPPIIETSQPAATQQQTETLVHDAIEQYLRDQTGHSLWRVELTLDVAEHRRVARFGNKLAISGGRKPWTGKQRFKILAETAGQNVVVAAQVARIQPIIVANQTIEQGNLIRATDVQLRQHEGIVSSHAFSTLDQVIGMEARRSIQADTIVQESHVRAPLQVERGETVKVYARTAGVAVRTFAIARQDGAMGDLVQVQTLDSKDRFIARVSGRRELEVFATGARAGDFATLRRRKTLQR